MRKFKDVPADNKLLSLVEFMDSSRANRRALAKVLRTHGYADTKDNIDRLSAAFSTLAAKRGSKASIRQSRENASRLQRSPRKRMGVLSDTPMEERLRRARLQREREIGTKLPHVYSITLQTNPDNIGVTRTSSKNYTLTVGPDWRTEIYNRGMAVAERNFTLMAHHITTHDDGIEVYRAMYWRPTPDSTEEIQKGWLARIDWSDGNNTDVVCCYGKTPTTAHSNMQRKLGKKAGSILTRGLDDDDN